MSKKCIVDDCSGTTDKGGKGYCGKHYMRFKRYGDINYITPESIRLQRLREAQPNLGKVKKNTYKKLFGRHEHRVVAENKIGRKLLPSEHVHHIDGNKHNNHPDNLIVMSSSEHGQLHGHEFNPKGSTHRHCKLTEVQVREIRELDLPQSKIAKLYGISQGSVCHVRTRRTYRDIE